MYCKIGIQAISSYIPKKRISNYDHLKQFGLSENFIVNKIGVLSKAVKSDDEETSDLCLKAFHALKEKEQITTEEIKCVIVCTQNPEGDGLPHTAAILCDKMGCSKETAAFDISLGCSGFVYSLAIAGSFMESNGFNKGLLFTADPYSKIVDPSDKNTSLIFGDAASVTLMSENPLYVIDKILFGTDGSGYDAIYSKDKCLKMNGRLIFNFVMTDVPAQVKKLLDITGCRVDDIDLFAFHPGSKYIIDSLIKRLNLEPQKVPINISEFGNTVSSSIPLLLENYINVDGYNNILISGFGVGLSLASAILRKTKHVMHH